VKRKCLKTSDNVKEVSCLTINLNLI